MIPASFFETAGARFGIAIRSGDRRGRLKDVPPHRPPRDRASHSDGWFLTGNGSGEKARRVEAGISVGQGAMTPDASFMGSRDRTGARGMNHPCLTDRFDRRTRVESG